jgi:arylformamidase
LPTSRFSRDSRDGKSNTYIDAPFHRYGEGRDLSQLELALLANLDGLVIHSFMAARAIRPEIFEGRKIKDKAVLIHSSMKIFFNYSDALSRIHEN